MKMIYIKSVIAVKWAEYRLVNKWHWDNWLSIWIKENWISTSSTKINSPCAKDISYCKIFVRQGSKILNYGMIYYIGIRGTNTISVHSTTLKLGTSVHQYYHKERKNLNLKIGRK